MNFMQFYIVPQPNLCQLSCPAKVNFERYRYSALVLN